MLKPLDNYFEKLAEPDRACLQFLRGYISGFDPDITEAWKYGMPFFCYKKKMFCYLWTHKKFKQPYIGFVEGDYVDDGRLLREKRARMAILLLDPAKDLPMKRIELLLKKAMSFYKKEAASTQK
jgi:hypothetical protein